MTKASKSNQSNREIFLEKVLREFPEAFLGGDYGKGLLHVEMADFRMHLEEKIEHEQIWAAEKGFKLIEDLLANADSDLKNAIEISFFEDFALGQQTDKQIAFVKDRASKQVRAMLKTHSEIWP